MGFLNRRSFVQLTSATWIANSLRSAGAQPEQDVSVRSVHALRLGAVAWVGAGQSADSAIKRVHDLGLPTCQIGFEHLSLNDVGPLKQAANEYGIEVTAVSEHGPGRLVYDFYEGPATIGIVPPYNPNHHARIEALKLAADVASLCDVPSVHTHLGFIPEEPNDPIYPHALTAVKDVATHCRERGRLLLCETGQETPIALLRMIQDVGLDNVFVNLDLANLILYGKGNPVDAMDVIGHLVRGIHAKDGLFPTDPRHLGKEVSIGTGRVDFPGVFKELKRVNYSGPITIEREISGEQQTKDILQSKIFLQNLIDRTYN